MSNVIEIDEILHLLPHRYPLLLIDRVVDYEPFSFLKAIKSVSINEPFFQGHFPGRPIMPGVLILEALAQACGVLSNKSCEPSEGKENLFFFAGIDNARFKQVVTPGDQLELHVSFTKQRRDIWLMHGEAFVDGKLACSADLLSAVKEV